MTDLVDARAIAKHLGLSVSSVHNMARSGRIPHYRMPGRGSGRGGAIRFRLEEIDEWLRELRRLPVARDDSGTHSGTRRTRKSLVLSDRYENC